MSGRTAEPAPAPAARPREPVPDELRPFVLAYARAVHAAILATQQQRRPDEDDQQQQRTA